MFPIQGLSGCGDIDSLAIIHYHDETVADGIPRSSTYDWKTSLTVNSCDIDGDMGPTEPLYKLTSAGKVDLH